MQETRLLIAPWTYSTRQMGAILATPDLEICSWKANLTIVSYSVD